VSARAKVGVVATEVEGEPLEPSCVGEGEGCSSQRGMLMHAEDPSKVDLR